MPRRKARAYARAGVETNECSPVRFTTHAAMSSVKAASKRLSPALATEDAGCAEAIESGGGGP